MKNVTAEDVPRHITAEDRSAFDKTFSEIYEKLLIIDYQNRLQKTEAVPKIIINYLVWEVT